MNHLLNSAGVCFNAWKREQGTSVKGEHKPKLKPINPCQSIF